MSKRDPIIARLDGVALVYDVVDDHGTLFAPGCLRSSLAPVSRGRVKAFLDHGDSPSAGIYRTPLHIGTVRSLTDTRLADGRRAALVSISIFDTEEGRRAVEYVQAVLGSKSETGLSLAFVKGGEKTESASVDGKKRTRFLDVPPIEEISVTARQSVPGCIVTDLTVRPAEGWATLAQRLEGVARSKGFASILEQAEVSRLRRAYGKPRYATMAERDAALRQCYEKPAKRYATMAERKAALRQVAA